jgi:hypothetical protein
VWVAGLVAIVGIPLSMLIFGTLSLVFRHPKRSKDNRGWWVAINGVVAYVITVVPFLLGFNRDLTCVYAYLAYAAVATCYWRWFPPLSVKDRGVENHRGE